ncbi:MAG: DUF3099 domain-containing protein [Candidatus Nanopelagicales bacterium]
MPRDAEVHRITSAQPDPSAELVHRERQYLILMGTRMVAIVVAVVVPGVWRWIAIAAGVLLPYLAVVLVNSAKVRGTPDDPYYVPPVEKVAIPDTAFEGLIITPDPDA